MGSRCFLPEPIKKFFPKNREKTKGRKWGCLMDKNALCTCTWALSIHCSSSPFFFPPGRCLFFFPFHLDVASSSSSSSSSSSFLPLLPLLSVFFRFKCTLLFFFFFLLLSFVFFFFFFGCLSPFLVLIEHHF